MIVYNSEFEIIKSIDVKNISPFVSLDWSIDGKYILFTHGGYLEIFDYEKFSNIRSFKTGDTMFAEFVKADDDKNIFLGSPFKGRYLDFKKMITE